MPSLSQKSFNMSDLMILGPNSQERVADVGRMVINDERTPIFRLGERGFFVDFRVSSQEILLKIYD